MNTLALLAFFLGVSAAPDSLGLPELHRIRTATLSPSYSCRPAEEFARGYANTVLFLSAHAMKSNSPDLVFNGACGSPNYFEANTAGSDLALISDLGEALTLEALSADQATNPKRAASEANYSSFRAVAPVRLGHTYAVLLAHSDRRALFFFTVTEFEPSKSVAIRYAVKLYEVFPTSSPGFAWSAKNRQ